MTGENAKPFDRQLLALRRRRAAGEIASHEFLLKRVAEDFVDRLMIVKREFPKVLNVGSHHGVVSRAIEPLPSIGGVVDYDHSPELLAMCEGLKVLGDEETLAFGAGDFDLVISGLSLQFVNDLPGALIQIRRALKPDGLFLAAVLGGETLKELRHAWLTAEAEITGGASPRVAPFVDVRALGQLAQRAGFALPVADSDLVTVTYESPIALMRDLRGMGAGNVLAGRRKVPVTRELMARVCEVYQECFGLPDGRVEATFEILTLTSWVPDESQPKPLKPGSAQISLADVLGKTGKE